MRNLIASVGGTQCCLITEKYIVIKSRHCVFKALEYAHNLVRVVIKWIL